MKTLLLLFLYTSTWAQCPPQGDNKNPKIQAADRLKNRSMCPDTSFSHAVALSTFLGDQVADTGIVYTEGYLTYVKMSGPESCECHSTDPADLDYHIYIGQQPGSAKKNCLIVEVSRYSRAFNPDLTFQYVKSLTGQKVRVYGFCFADDEHKSAIGSWRAGITEIHPVFYIENISHKQ